MKKSLAGIMSKLMTENKIEIKYPDVNGIYFDIETYNHANPGVPKFDDEDSHISMICAVMNSHVSVWLRKQFTFNISIINDKIKNHTSEVTNK